MNRPLLTAYTFVLLAALLGAGSRLRADIIQPGSKKIPIGWAISNPDAAKGYLLTANGKPVKANVPYFSLGKPVFLQFTKSKNTPKETKNNVCTYVGEFEHAQNIRQVLVVYTVGLEDNQLVTKPFRYDITYETGARLSIAYTPGLTVAQAVEQAAQLEPPVKTQLDKTGLNAGGLGWMGPQNQNPWLSTAGWVGIGGLALLAVLVILALRFRRPSRT